MSIIWDHTNTDSKSYAFLSRPTEVVDQFSSTTLSRVQHFSVLANFKGWGGRILSEAELGTVSTYVLDIPSRMLDKVLEAPYVL